MDSLDKRCVMEAGDVFMMAVKFNKVDALRPLLEPFDWANIPALSQKDVDRAFIICCQNNYVELAQLLLPGADIANERFMGLTWALQKDHFEIVDIIIRKMTVVQLSNADGHMKWSPNAEKWQQYRLRHALTQTVGELGSNNTSRKM